MRRVLTAVFGVILIPGALVALPVVTAPSASAHPVTPTINHLAVPLPHALAQSPAAVVAPSGQSESPAGAPLLEPATAPGPEQDTKPFRALALTWKHDPKLTNFKAEVRVRTDGVWSEWQELSSADNGPDGGGDGGTTPSRDGTDPLWVDHADGVQVDVEGFTGDAPSDLRVDLIDPGSSAADKNLTGSKPLSGAAVALADTAEPAIITRAQWGADPSLRLNACPSGPEDAGPIKVAFVHHTVTSNDYTPDDVPAIVRSIYAYHVQGEGWCDIGYNFLVDKFGRIFEGRYGGVANTILGAHTGGFNANSFGVSMIGTYTSVTPPQALTDALVRLISWKFSISYLNPMGHETLTAAPFSQNRYATGTNVVFNSISGHRDADVTSCPGDAGYAVLPFLRQAVFDTMGAGLVDPSAAVTAPRSLSSSGSVHVSAGMLKPGDWTIGIAGPNGNTVRTVSGSGSSVDFTWNMTDDSGNLVPIGNYALTVISSQGGVAARPWTTMIQVGGAFGDLESVTASIGHVEARGYALHGSDDAPDAVRITVSSATAATVVANDDRPDVAADHPGYSAAHGFDTTVSASGGYHTVCAYAKNDVIGGADALLGCIGVTVPGTPPALTGPAANPVGHLDQVEGGPAEAHVRGWTLDPETAQPISVAVYVDNVFKTYFVAASGRPDVANAHPDYGPDHGFDQLVGGVAPGTHRVCVYAMNVGNGTTNPTLGCGTAVVPTGNPTGHLDTVQPTPGGIVTWGWATDPDTAGPITVHLLVDGHLQAAVPANQSRADVAAHFPLYGADHGFATIQTLTAGRHQLCAYAMNVGGGNANVNLGCGTVTVMAGNPIGHLDTVQPTPGGAVLWGWAIDPDTASADGVTISVDGKTVADMSANLSRPDVGAHYRAYGNDHGFATILTLTAGKHTVCVDANNIMAGTANTRVGCGTVNVMAGNPFGHLDVAQASGGNVTFWGWAIDPDVAAPIDVHAYLDGKLVTIMHAANPRPDVAGHYPAYGVDHGYAAVLPVTPGTHRLCTFAINVAAGTTNPQLGCLSFSS